MPEIVRITGTGQLLELRRRLNNAGGPRLRDNFQRRIRRAAEPLKTGMVARVETLDITGSGSGSGNRWGNNRPLRATLASAIKITVRGTGDLGAKVWFDKSALPPDLRKMPDKLNDGHWRHPVFGNRHAWVSQYSRPAGFWRKTIAEHESRMRSEVERVLNDVTNMLD